eukprot:SAG31_NODE_5505_length_2496_cov_2.588652_3_plen_139_part_00
MTVASSARLGLPSSVPPSPSKPSARPEAVRSAGHSPADAKSLPLASAPRLRCCSASTRIARERLFRVCLAWEAMASSSRGSFVGEWKNSKPWTGVGVSGAEGASFDGVLRKGIPLAGKGVWSADGDTFRGEMLDGNLR